ncbi:hypothetical protein BSL78_08940 [Apostichopus japonicus]|uniref:RNA-directed DNA polymerase n=1 Tax=Stichopus japonicus TaxID=307972 RepID=A0A2G8L1S4_STIJA|nr:hypothetical protein BSL78_08940 [Apostichopus japonicus]
MAAIPPPAYFLPTPGAPTLPWVQWKQVFDNYLLAAGGDAYTPSRKKALLLHCLGTEGQRIYYSLDQANTNTASTIAPSTTITPPTTTATTGNIGTSTSSTTASSDTGTASVINAYDLAVAILYEYFVPATNIVAERYRFRQRSQRHDETIDQFVTALRQLVVHCEFGDLQQEMLRDQIVEKCLNNRLRERLLLEPKLTLNKTLEISRQIEGAMRESKAISEGASGYTAGSANLQNVHGKQSKRRNKKHSSHEAAQSNKQNTDAQKRVCYRCGSDKHLANDPNCKAKTGKCNKCGIVGHWAAMCRGQKQARGSNVAQVEILTLQNSSNSHSSAIKCTVDIANGVKCKMTVDTGAEVTIVPVKWFDQHFLREGLQQPAKFLTTYSKEQIPVLGTFYTTVKLGSKSVNAHIYVVDIPTGTPLLGIDLIKSLDLQITGGQVKIQRVEDSTLAGDHDQGLTSQLTDEFPILFSSSLGRAHNFVHRVKTRQDVTPVAQKLRRLPFSVRDKVTAELKRLEKEGIIERTDASEWVSPIVVVGKKSGKIRLCIDLREANKAVIVDKYPLPSITELFNNLQGAKIFSKLDLASAYHQLELSEDSRDLTAFITHEGLYRFKRVCFGLASAPSAFQKMMSSILAGLPGVECYLDDIIVYGTTEVSHHENLSRVLAKLQAAGLRLNIEKCEFDLNSLTYLGHTISGEGLTPDQSHVEAILKAPAPTDLTTLRSALGLCNYYAKFVPNYATVVEPLRVLLRKDTPFNWGEEQKRSFYLIKQAIAQGTTLALFDPNSPLLVTTDASNYGIGGVLSQVKDGQEFPIAFASKTLTSAERKYSAGEKEALACVWACNKWFTYLWGRHFTLRTDHQALVTLLNTSGTGRQPMRIARWSAQLLQFNYTVEYQAGKHNFVADALSRLPTNVDAEIASCDEDTEEFVLSCIQAVMKDNSSVPMKN